MSPVMIPPTFLIAAVGNREKVRVALYLRVSSEEQVKGWSLGNQERDLRAYSKRKDWVVVSVYKDAGLTGMDTNREEYRRMIAAMANWDVALASKGDRFHRNTDNSREFMRQARAAGKQVWTIAEGRIDAPEKGEVEYVALQPMASHEISTVLTTQMMPAAEAMTISDRVLPGKWVGKKAGRPQGRMPLGFTWNKPDGVFVMTLWATEFDRAVNALGITEAIRRNPIPSGRRQEQLLSQRAAFRLLANIRAFNEGTLIPNRRRTDVPGFFSKFEKKWPAERRALERRKLQEAESLSEQVTCACGKVLADVSRMKAHLLSSIRHREWVEKARGRD